MKYFEHYTSDRDNVVSKLIRRKFGAEGYGIYVSLLEVIGENVKPNNLDDWGHVDPMHDLESLAIECSTSTEKLKEFLAFCDEKHIFEKHDGRLFSSLILERLDAYANKIRQSLTKSNKVAINRIEENRIEEKRTQENRIKTIPPQKNSEGSKTTVSKKKTEALNKRLLQAKEESEIFNTPEDREVREKMNLMPSYLKTAVFTFLLLLLPFINPVFAETVIIRYHFSSPLIKPSSSQKLEPKSKSSTPSGNKKIQKDVGSTATALSEIPDVKEREFIAKLPHAEQVANIYKHESGFGKNDVCRNFKGYNGFGYGESGNGPNCFATFEAVATQVSMWIENRKYLSSDVMTCLYIRGLEVSDCKTSYRFL